MIIQGKKCDYEVVIGLEVHTQIKTDKKLFSTTAYTFAEQPNTAVNCYDMALPGVLPVLNFEVIEQAVKTGLAIDGHINKYSVFDRKSYFYPDLPSGYQITQMYYPIVENGFIEIIGDNGEAKKIRVERIHIEQDAGKLIHDKVVGKSCIDLNRSGVPLMEIVTKPDIKSQNEAVSYLKKLHGILRAIESSDADMEKGSFRCDVNVSVMPVGATEFGTRCEIKNVNSFKFVKDAIEFEAARQVDVLDGGGAIEQQTRLYDANKGETFAIRNKANAADYKYFPDPDLLPVIIDDVFIDKIRSKIPELPEARKARYIKDYLLIERDAQALVEDEVASKMFDNVIAEGCDGKMAFSWIMAELNGRLKKLGISLENCNVNAEKIADLIKNIHNGVISGKMAKDVLDEMLESNKTATQIIDEKGLKQMDNSDEIEAVIKQIILDNPEKVAEYKSGKDKLFAFFVGQTMKATGGKANPQKISDLLHKNL